jgi:hypothetical protein
VREVKIEFCGPSGRVVTSEYSSDQANIAGKKINWLLVYDTIIAEEPNESFFVKRRRGLLLEFLNIWLGN